MASPVDPNNGEQRQQSEFHEIETAHQVQEINGVTAAKPANVSATQYSMSVFEGNIEDNISPEEGTTLVHRENSAFSNQFKAQVPTQQQIDVPPAQVPRLVIQEPSTSQGSVSTSQIAQAEEEVDNKEKHYFARVTVEAELAVKAQATTEQSTGLALSPTGASQAMEGMNIEEIDEAVEKALLNEDSNASRDPIEDVEMGDDSCVSSKAFVKPNAFKMMRPDAKITDCSEDNDVEQELRKQKKPPAHVPEKVYNIDEETRMGLDQTPIDPSMMDSMFNYPLPPKKLFPMEDTKDLDTSDVDTKMSMSMMSDTEDIRLRNTISIDDATKDSAASDSNMETPTPMKRSRRASRESLLVDAGEDGEHDFTAEQVFEYQWPQDGGDWYLLQEQISEYLKIKSFKRKYPDLFRRVCDKEEKDFLREKGVVTETQSDLGLTALRSEEVYDLMMKDYNDKYREYLAVLQEKQKRVIKEKHKEYSVQPKMEKSKIEAYSKKAAQAAAEYNASILREKREERRAYFDLQTYVIHYPKNRYRRLPPNHTKVGAYPVALIEGQFQDYYRKYNPKELNVMPLRTVITDPPKLEKYVKPPPEGLKSKSPTKSANSKSEGDVSALAEVSKTEPGILDAASIGTDTAELNEKENDVIFVSATENDAASTPVKSEKKKSKKKSLGAKTPKKANQGGGEKSSEKGVTEGDEEDPEASKMPPKIHGLEKCRICKQRSTKEERRNEKLVKCAECGKIGHTSCLDLTEELVAVIKTYPWQCMECKTCVECMDPYDEDKMMFCDRCDRGYHTFCIGLQALPTGHWECKSCEGAPKIMPKSGKKSKTSKVKQSSFNAEVKEEEVSQDGSVSMPPPTPGDNGGTETPMEVEKVEAGETLDQANGNTADAESVQGAATQDESVKTEPDADSKVEKRGRKRKNPDVPTKPKPEKVERIQGARQSRRLKLKEEEEEERKKKEEEEKKLKKKLKKEKKKALKAAALKAKQEGTEVKTESVEEEGNKEEGGEEVLLLEEPGVDSPVVSEGVDDRAVHLFGKAEDEDVESPTSNVEPSAAPVSESQQDSVASQGAANTDIKNTNVENEQTTAGTDDNTVPQESGLKDEGTNESSTKLTPDIQSDNISKPQAEPEVSNQNESQPKSDKPVSQSEDAKSSTSSQMTTQAVTAASTVQAPGAATEIQAPTGANDEQKVRQNVQPVPSSTAREETLPVSQQISVAERDSLSHSGPVSASITDSNPQPSVPPPADCVQTPEIIQTTSLAQNIPETAPSSVATIPDQGVSLLPSDKCAAVVGEEVSRDTNIATEPSQSEGLASQAEPSNSTETPMEM